MFKFIVSSYTWYIIKNYFKRKTLKVLFLYKCLKFLKKEGFYICSDFAGFFNLIIFFFLIRDFSIKHSLGYKVADLDDYEKIKTKILNLAGRLLKENYYPEALKKTEGIFKGYDISSIIRLKPSEADMFDVEAKLKEFAYEYINIPVTRTILDEEEKLFQTDKDNVFKIFSDKFWKIL